MSLHDRDYVREKDFNYKKMEYEIKPDSKNQNDSLSNSSKHLDFVTIQDSKTLPYVFLLVFFVIGVLVYFKNHS